MTIKEIARLANVSSAAVSRYLNGGYISEEKRAQIKKVIEETGYHPSAQARTLRTKRASLIGVVVPKINSESISRVTEGIGNVLAARGYQMLLASTDNNAKKEIEYLHLFEKYPVDGIILIGTMITAEHRRFLKNARIPVVVTGQNTKYANCVYHDDYGAGKAMGKLAASLSGKNKHIAYIGVTREDKAAGAAREDGFRAGLKSEGRELEEKDVRISAFRAEAGYEAALSLLDEETDIGVISCATDTIAAGAIRALRDRGIRLAQDRSVLPQARLVLPDEFREAAFDGAQFGVLHVFTPFWSINNKPPPDVSLSKIDQLVKRCGGLARERQRSVRGIGCGRKKNRDHKWCGHEKNDRKSCDFRSFSGGDYWTRTSGLMRVKHAL